MIKRTLFALSSILMVAMVFSSSAAASQNLQVGVFLPERSQQAISNHEAQVGRHQDMVMFYQAWGNGGLDAERVQWIIDNGSTPMITWEPWVWSSAGANQPDYSLRKITAGNHDAYIRAFARSVRQINGTVLIRPMHEMNGDWYPWGGTVNGNSPGDYIPAFRHIVDLFRQEGADNARWVWSPNNGGLPDWNTSEFRSYYPGDGYVDFAAVDGYNAGTTESWSQWSSFRDVFDQAYRTITSFTQKPIIIAETASTEVGGSKAAWITDAFNQMKSNYPNISAVIWFNENKESDWRIDSSSGSLTAYKAALAGLGSTPPSDTSVDTRPPTGSVTINNGANWTDNRRVTLSLQGADTGGSGLRSVRIRNSGGSWTALQDFTSSSAWALTSGNRNKRVDIQLKDGAGNVSTIYSDTINYKAPAIKVYIRNLSTTLSTNRARFDALWRPTVHPSGRWLYTVKYRSGGSNIWRTLRIGTAATSIGFRATRGETYNLRVTARDSRGHTIASPIKTVVIP